MKPIKRLAPWSKAFEAPRSYRLPWHLLKPGDRIKIIDNATLAQLLRLRQAVSQRKQRTKELYSVYLSKSNALILSFIGKGKPK